MPYYEVELERTLRQRVLIEARDKSEAEEGAGELADSNLWDDEDSHAYVTILSARPTDRYWSGGEHGRWVDPK